MSPFTTHADPTLAACRQIGPVKQPTDRLEENRSDRATIQTHTVT